jgi:hypothetical protein
MNLKRLVPISLIALSLSIFAPISLFITQAQAEVVEVEGQGDCPGGNDGWQRHLIVDIAAKRTYTRCVRIEVVPVPTPTPTPTPTPSSTPTPTASSTPTPTASSAPVTTTPETVTRVAGATDPYPNISTGGEVPGTRIWSTSETSWVQFYNNTNAANWRCPSIYGPNGDPYAGESNGYDSGAGKWFRVCVKNPWREPIPRSVTSNYEAQKSTAMAEALAKSQAWNTENPGKQKCFEWGPLTNPSGGTESGGVCANPVGVSSGTSQTDTRTVTSQTDTRTVTSQTDTRTVTTKTVLVPQSETRTAQVAEVVSISNSKERTVAAVELIKTFDSAEKERALDVTYKSKKSTVIAVDLAVPGIPVVVTATKKGSPTITLKSTTDTDGDAQIKTTKNLEGYSVTLTVNKTKIDTDVVKKQK